MLAREKLSSVPAILHECSLNLSLFFNTQHSQEILFTRHSCSMEWKPFFKVSENCIFNLLTTRNSFL